MGKPRKVVKKLIKSDKQYKKELKELQKYFNFNFDLRHKLTPQRKALITKRKNYLEGINAEFIPINKTNRKAIKELGRSKTTVKTNKGIFVRGKPYDEKIKIKTARFTKLEFTKVFSTATIESVVKKVKFITYPLINPILFADNPDYWITLLPNYKKATGAQVNVGNVLARSHLKYNANLFEKYIINLTGRKGEEIQEFVTGVTLIFKIK